MMTMTTMSRDKTIASTTSITMPCSTSSLTTWTSCLPTSVSRHWAVAARPLPTCHRSPNPRRLRRPRSQPPRPPPPRPPPRITSRLWLLLLLLPLPRLQPPVRRPRRICRQPRRQSWSVFVRSSSLNRIPRLLLLHQRPLQWCLWQSRLRRMPTVRCLRRHRRLLSFLLNQYLPHHRPLLRHQHLFLFNQHQLRHRLLLRHHHQLRV